MRVAGASLTLRVVGRLGDTGPESESARQLIGSITQYKIYKLNEALSERHAVVTIFANDGSGKKRARRPRG